MWKPFKKKTNCIICKPQMEIIPLYTTIRVALPKIFGFTCILCIGATTFEMNWRLDTNRFYSVIWFENVFHCGQFTELFDNPNEIQIELWLTDWLRPKIHCWLHHSNHRIIGVTPQRWHNKLVSVKP